MFTRRTISLSSISVADRPPPTPPVTSDEEINVLVINSSQAMAKEITMQLTLSMPGCSIMYAPTLEIARWIISKRKLNLIVSSPILPDGNVIKLRDVLEKKQNPPDLVVVGDVQSGAAEAFSRSGYKMTSVKRMKVPADTQPAPRPAPPLRRISPITRNTESLASRTEVIRTLGADLRNDLNNPLQEIVAMVFVAKNTGTSGQTTTHALDAIDSAAKNLAKVVQGLENKILEAVK